MQGTILIVDDEPSICEMLKNKLGQEGYECHTCGSAEEALQVLRGTTFDAIISDLGLPKMSGTELMETVLKANSQIAFMIVTGQGDVRVGIDAMKRGAEDYLVKPFQLAAVVASVERALQKRRMAIELENYRQNLEQMVEQRTRQLQTAMKRIETTYDETLEALGAALDLRDTETEGHSRRVSRFCMEIARSMGCSADQLRHISRGSYLHDIGKIGIPDAILLKAGRLTEEETAVMQTHARVGYELVSKIGFLTAAAEIVLTHQERFDGTGYPQGLVGEEIPLGARIFAVADTLDAMTSDRPYRRALPFSTARAEITLESGRQFDPDVVRVFLGLPVQLWEKIRMEVAGIRFSYVAAQAASAQAKTTPFGLPVPAPLLPLVAAVGRAAAATPVNSKAGGNQKKTQDTPTVHNTTGCCA